MGWIARLFRALGRRKRQEPEASDNYEDTVKIETSEIKQEKSLGAEVHGWLDETQSLKDESRADQSIDEADDEHTTTVPTLKESDLPNLDDLDDDKTD